MSLDKIYLIMKFTLLCSLTFCVISTGIFFLRLAANTQQVSTQAVITLRSIQKDITDFKEMANSTLYQIGDVSHETADMVRLEKQYVQQESRQLIITNQKLNETLDTVQLAIRSMDQTSQKALAPLPALLKQSQATVQAMQTTLDSTSSTVDQLNIVVTKLQPAADNLSGTLKHIDSISEQLDKLVQNATKPQPWYKKILTDLWVPAKLITIFSK
jgi:ABC-type transporter Mla subunit MlaD